MLSGTISTGSPQSGSGPFVSEKKMFRLQGSWYSNRAARTRGFNAKIGFENMHRDPRYYQKSVENQPSKPNQQNLTHFG